MAKKASSLTQKARAMAAKTYGPLPTWEQVQNIDPVTERIIYVRHDAFIDGYLSGRRSKVKDED